MSFSQGLIQEGVCASFFGSLTHRQNAEHQNGDRSSSGVCLQLAAQCEPVQLRNQYLGNDYIWLQLTSLLQRRLTIQCECNSEARCLKKVGFQLTNVRITFHN